MTSHLARLTDVVNRVCVLVDGAVVDSTAVDSTVVDSTVVDNTVVDDAVVDNTVVGNAAVTLVGSIRRLTDTQLQRLLRDAGSGRAEFDRVISIAAGEAAKRSRRELGHSGLAQQGGHRSAVQLVQVLTGESSAEARRQVRLGELLGEADAHEATADAVGDVVDLADPRVPSPEPETTQLPWQHPVTTAISAGSLVPEIGHLIIRTLEDVSESCPVEARRAAADELVRYATAGSRPADDGEVSGPPQTLRDDVFRRARQVRDRIDAVGVEDRFARRYQKRSLKTWRDTDGALNLHAVADDESGVFLTQLFDLALSPRRGGPRFVSKADTAWAQAMADDSRTNEQLMFDTFMQIVHHGTSCDENTVFRGERPGVRVITVSDTSDDVACGSGADGAPECGCDAHGGVACDHRSAPFGNGVLEGSPDAIPASFVAAAVCECGVTPIVTDRDGRVLNLGRTQRGFSPAQRVVMRARDGGCLWSGCPAPPWQGEAHHINPWSDGGRTDVADGVLLCRFHHLNLHAHHWRIRRRGTDYELIPPPGRPGGQTPIPLLPKTTTWENVRVTA